MPITLGCPSCGKRFRARDESAGKRVRCPYCGSPVSVPTPEESAAAGAPTLELPPPPAPGRPAKPAAAPAAPRSGAMPPTPAAAVASPDDWGAAEPPKPYSPPPSAPSARPPVETSAPGALDDLPKSGRVPAGRAAVARPAARPAAATAAGAKTPEQLAAPGWKKTRAGLCWVLFALFLFALPGFIGFAKAVCVRAGIELPRGPGADWISITGYLNSPDPNSIKMTKEEMVDAAAYGIPVVLGGLCLAFGRLTCGAAPRNSGAKGMFALSGMFTFVAVAGLVTAAACDKLLFEEEYRYARYACLITAGVAEFWFLTGLAVSGVALKRPKAARAVGLLGFFVALLVAVATIGWMIYAKQYRPVPLTDDMVMYEQAGVMLGWLMLVGLYWRAVRSVRGAISEFVENVEE